MKSQDRLNTCNADLIRLFNEIIKHRDCTIICGRRGKREQDEAFKNNKSKVKYPNSYHNRFPSRAIDAAPYPLDWHDLGRFIEFGGYVLGVAAVLNISLEWGGHWKTLKDYVHFQTKDG